MLQQHKPQGLAACHLANQPARSAPDAGTLLKQLHAAGCEPLLSHSRAGLTGCGLSMELSVQQLLRSQADFDETANVIRGQLTANQALTITLRDFGEQQESAQALEEFCSGLHVAGVPRSNRLSVCLATPSLLLSPSLRAFSLITRCWLGDGYRYVLLDTPQMQQFVTDTWQYLWRFRTGRWAVLPAYADIVATPCPLLADEPASALLPVFGMQAPAASAWLPIRLHLPRFADPQGVIRLEALHRALSACIGTGEQLLDLLHWPTPEIRRDAIINRRIAINITGFGDLVRLQNKDPSDFGVLQSLLRIAHYIRTTVWEHSERIARHASLLPAIAKNEPLVSASDEHHNHNWAARWQVAIERSAVRHRNLLVVSPYSVIPTGDPGCAAYVDLLPVIGFADAYHFAAEAPLRNWNIADFCRFHRRAHAVMQHRNCDALVATRA